MLLFKHRQTGKDPIDTCFREQMGHNRWNSFQRVYLFVSCHGLNQGGYYFRMDSAAIPVNGKKKKSKSLFVWIRQNQPLGEETSWSLLKFYWQFCNSTSEMLDFQARCLKYEYSHLQNFKQTDESLLKNNWEYKNFFKNAKYHSAF